MHNDDIASVCLSAFIADETHAVDIETVEVYRRRNYGAMVAKSFVEECGRVGIHPYWDCSPDNAGSIRLAQGVGMSLVLTIEFTGTIYPRRWGSDIKEDVL